MARLVRIRGVLHRAAVVVRPGHVRPRRRGRGWRRIDPSRRRVDGTYILWLVSESRSSTTSRASKATGNSVSNHYRWRLGLMARSTSGAGLIDVTQIAVAVYLSAPKRTPWCSSPRRSGPRRSLFRQVVIRARVHNSSLSLLRWPSWLGRAMTASPHACRAGAASMAWSRRDNAPRRGRVSRVARRRQMFMIIKWTCPWALPPGGRRTTPCSANAYQLGYWRPSSGRVIDRQSDACRFW